MFRELRRKNKALPLEACLELLRNEKRGVLSVLGDDGYPYGMPMNHFYCDEDGALYFHCGHGGHRLDALEKCDKASFCVLDRGHRAEGDWTDTVISVIVFGKVEVLDDPVLIRDITARLSRKFTSDEAHIAREIALYAHETLLLRLTPQHITGKQVREE